MFLRGSKEIVKRHSSIKKIVLGSITFFVTHCGKKNLGRENPENTNLILFLVLGFAGLGLFILPAHVAFAAPPVISFDICCPSEYTLNDFAQVTVDDSTNPVFTTNVVIDKIQVTASSSLESKKITLTETGANSGIFQNMAIIFTEEPDKIIQERSYTITQKETVGVNPNVIDAVPVDITSVDPLTGNTDSLIPGYILTETGKNTEMFTGKIKFTAGPTTGTALHVPPGDYVYVSYNGEFHYGLVSPNPNDSVDILSAANCLSSAQAICDTITVSYSGAADVDAHILKGSGGGGGGGGLIRPGLVLDFLAAIGGSPYIISPPSFGGGYYHYSDGLTLTQGDTKTTFDTSQYNHEIPKQVMVAAQPVNMTFKTFESYNPTGIIHMGLYLIPRGHDMVTDNSIGSIIWEKGNPVEVSDPNHILSDATASSTDDDKFQYISFSFTPTKSYDKMSFLVRAWNDHLYSTDIRVHDDIVASLAVKTLPAGVIQYDNLDDLQAALEKDQFYKPQLLSHIHGTSDVFPNSEGGNVYWLYDTIQHAVTLVIADKNDNILSSKSVILQPYVAEKKGDYKFMYFTVQQLNRWNEDQLKIAMELEAEKAMSSALEKRIILHSNW